MWVFYLTEVAVNCGYFHGFWSSPKNCCFVKGVLGKCMHLLLDRLQEKTVCSLLFLETGKHCIAVTKYQTC